MTKIDVLTFDAAHSKACKTFGLTSDQKTLPTNKLNISKRCPPIAGCLDKLGRRGVQIGIYKEKYCCK